MNNWVSKVRKNDKANSETLSVVAGIIALNSMAIVSDSMLQGGDATVKSNAMVMPTKLIRVHNGSHSGHGDLNCEAFVVIEINCLESNDTSH